MHSIKFDPKLSMLAQRKELIGLWLDSKDLTWSQRLNDGSFTVVTDLTPAQLEVVASVVASYAPGTVIDTMEEAVIEPPSVSVVTQTNQTWYQYQARVRGVTGCRITTDRHDEVMLFSEEKGRFTYAIRRVKYRETTQRDVTTDTLLELTVISRKEGGAWERNTRTVKDSELAPDHLNFGNIRGDREAHREYVHSLDLQRLETFDPGLLAALSIFARFPHIVSET